MPSRLPDNYKSLVIQEWLNGEQRDKIAVDSGIGAGSVTNIVNEWRATLGFPTADTLRELAVTLRRLGISAAQCALGSRIATLMLRIGVNEDSFESFILDVYNRCKDIGLSPQNIAFHLTDLLEFSNTALPLSKIPDYIKEKTTEKGKLEEEIEKLKAQIETLREQKEDAELIRDTALEDARITSFRLKWYTDLSEELRKYGIPVHDISKLVKLVNNVRQYDYDVEKVINEFSNLEHLRLQRKNLEESILFLEDTNRKLQEQRAGNEVFVNKHNQLINIYEHLEAMKFGIKELWFLRDTVMEIARENDIHHEEAVKKFLSDVELQYNNKLGFQSKIDSLRSEVNRLRMELLSLPLVAPKLVKLTQSGVSEQDIINIAAVFEKYVAGKDGQSFVSELEHYGGLKSAIQELSKQADKMRMEVSLLQTQNQDLNADNQMIIFSLVNSRHTFDFMQGLINSLRSEILGLVSLSAYITYSIGSQFEYLEKLKSSNGDGFALGGAYKGEENDSIQEIKKELIKPIENMESKPEVKDRLTGALSNVLVHVR